MDSWELLDSEEMTSTRTPTGSSVMALMRRGSEYVIRVDDRELMSNAAHASEDALAEMAIERLGRRPGARILIGGLGMGYTLAAALRRIDPDGRVVVAEMVPAVVRWNRGPIAHLAKHPLEDARAEIRMGDVADLIMRPDAPWSAILLDVDNGPAGLTKTENTRLYSQAGLGEAFAALEPGGILGVWSAFFDSGFTRRMKRAGFEVDVVEVRARGGKGGRRHVLWFGRVVKPQRNR